MAIADRRNLLLPWYIGLVLIGVVDAVTAYLFYSTGSEAPGFIQFLVLVAIPGIYLALMYLTFKSQP